MKDPTCEERWLESKNSTIDMLRAIMLKEQLGPDESWDDLRSDQQWEWSDGTEEDWDNVPPLHEYGLCFEWKGREDEHAPYFCYLLSTGGPQDEFRFYVDPDFVTYKVEYWFLDWYDGHGRALDGEDLELLKEIYGYLMCGDPAHFGAEMMRKAAA